MFKLIALNIANLHIFSDMEYKLTALTPMLETPDIETTFDFYTQVLDFTIRKLYARDGVGYIKIWHHSYYMFALPNAHRNIPKPIMSGSLYFATENNVDALWEKVKERCLICYPIENFDYGMREFGIYDNNGYLLQFGQEIAELILLKNTVI